MTSQTAKKQYELLLVEDNPGDAILMEEALKDGRGDIRLNVAVDGEKALQYLHREVPYSDAEKPDLIVLDLNLPKKHGLEVLSEIKKDPALREIPVVVLSGSKNNSDILKAYGMGSVCFITKPVGFYEFMESVKSIISLILK